ncbi:MAG: hypothetical protein DSY47_02095 [Hydrogenothermus sp.]|nr:MAG: hypothetical protein DSY47_02095 [Hydrogenothermus sp.]
MGLFKKRIEENMSHAGMSFKTVEKEIVIPQNNPLKISIDGSILTSILLTVAELGDSEDLQILSEKSASIFFEKNKRVFESIKVSSSDSVKVLVELLNKFLDYHRLGSVQVIIDESTNKFYIRHFNSPFALALLDKIESKVCYFLSHFYSRVFSLVLDSQIKIVEESCIAKEKNKDFCVFKPDNI